MTFEELQLLASCYKDRPIEQFLAACRALAHNDTAAEDEYCGAPEALPPLDTRAAAVDHYVARLQAEDDIDAVLVAINRDQRLRARECIAIAARLVPSARQPRSRNRALQVIRRHGHQARTSEGTVRAGDDESCRS